MARNNQVLESLMENLKLGGSLTLGLYCGYDPSMFCSTKDSGLRSFAHKATITRDRFRSLGVEPAEQKSDTETDINEVKQRGLVTPQLDIQRIQEDPLTVEIPGMA